MAQPKEPSSYNVRSEPKPLCELSVELWEALDAVKQARTPETESNVIRSLGISLQYLADHDFHNMALPKCLVGALIEAHQTKKPGEALPALIKKFLDDQMIRKCKIDVSPSYLIRTAPVVADETLRESPIAKLVKLSRRTTLRQNKTAKWLLSKAQIFDRYNLKSQGDTT